MQRIVFLLVMITSMNTWANGKAYLDIEEGQIVSVFSEPGMNWKSCRDKKGCEAVAWPDREARIQILEGPVKRMVEDLHTGRMVEEEYYKIRYEYDRKNSHGETIVQGGLNNPKAVGWIDAAYVSKTQKKTFYGSSTGKAETCETAPQTGKSPKGTIAPLAQAIGNQGVTATAAMVKPLVGACVINPKRAPTSYAEGNPFDTYVLPNLKKQKLPKIIKEDGKPMTEKDLIDIDALSRTLYAEMANCYKHGLQYPMAVAKIAMNRAKTESRHQEFIRGKHSSNKNELAKVVTSPTQFSLWLKKIDGKTNNSLRQALCPPVSGEKAFWTGANPSRNELDIWENTVRIATEAVLFPKRFNGRTGQVKEYFYTSGMSGFYGMKQVYPSIEDHKISRNSCMQVWSDKAKK